MNREKIWDKLNSFFVFIFFISGATGIGYFFNHHNFPQTNIVIIYIFAVLLISRFTEGFLTGILAALVSTFAFNYFFTVPYYTFSVNDPNYIVTFIVMTITSFITSAMTSKIKQSAKESAMRESEARALYQLTSNLSNAADMQAMIRLSLTAISQIFQCNVAFVCVNKDGILESDYIQQIYKSEIINCRMEDTTIIQKQLSKWKDGYIANSDFYDFPIRGNEAILGLLRIPEEKAKKIGGSESRILKVMLESTALAMDRFKQLQERIKANEKMVQEQYRGNLLRSISHDLRTPLSIIMGTSDMLMDMTRDDAQQFELASEIYKDADWLRNLVENILNLTKLQEGTLVICKEIEAVEEVVGSAVRHINKRSQEHRVLIEIPADLILIPMDAKLIEQVIINLLDNAIRHSKTDTEIKISVEEHKETGQVEFSVIDNGDGIAEADLPHIFEMFYTSYEKKSDVKHGIGLGLMICKTIINAHGGTISAENRKECKGTAIYFTLPIKEDKYE